jgi:hypothetical protein
LLIAGLPKSALIRPGSRTDAVNPFGSEQPVDLRARLVRRGSEVRQLPHLAQGDVQRPAVPDEVEPGQVMLSVAAVAAAATSAIDCFAAANHGNRMPALGRVHALLSGRFEGAHHQRLRYRAKPGKRSVMCRPEAVLKPAGFDITKQTMHRAC